MNTSITNSDAELVDDGRLTLETLRERRNEILRLVRLLSGKLT